MEVARSVLEVAGFKTNMVFFVGILWKDCRRGEQIHDRSAFRSYVSEYLVVGADIFFSGG